MTLHRLLVWLILTTGCVVSMALSDLPGMLLAALGALLLAWSTNGQHKGVKPWHKIP